MTKLFNSFSSSLTSIRLLLALSANPVHQITVVIPRAARSIDWIGGFGRSAPILLPLLP
ncbi:hypothetical protein [Rhizobium leguminosarum]|uniref:hypothetical protein n=1 Tax=Rhizobium leguminosarum TaxID=384 RepID=UPI001AEDFD6E|nr:hypothetical protein [Rhizobium leguminosarum]